MANLYRRPAEGTWDQDTQTWDQDTTAWSNIPQPLLFREGNRGAPRCYQTVSMDDVRNMDDVMNMDTLQETT
jgi:hypothetical protein